MASESDEPDLRFTAKKPNQSQQQPSSKSEFPSSPSISAKIYNFNHPKRGKAIIFNQYSFQNGSTRGGTDIDANNLESTFKRLGFEVDHYRNLTKNKLLKTLKKVADEDHSQNDCLAVIVMTHGEQKKLQAFDESYETSKLWESFSGDKCKTLAGKPKMFFIQACRGQDVDSGIRVAAAMSVTQVDGPIQITYVVPNMADIFVSYATFDGYYAFRNQGMGSWYVQELCQELNENGSTQELCQLLTSVNHRVAFKYESYVPHDDRMHKKRQIPNFFSSLTRQVYFTQKTRLFV